MGMKRVWQRRGLIVTAAIALAATSACAQKSNPPGESKMESKQGSKNKNTHILQTIPQGQEGKINVVTLKDKKYVAAQAIADLLEFRTFWDLDSLTMKMGAHDPEFELKADSTNAVKEGSPVVLPAAPIYEKDALYIPVEAVGELFGYDMRFQQSDAELTLSPSPGRASKQEINAPAQNGVQDELSFQDDPTAAPSEQAAPTPSKSGKRSTRGFSMQQKQADGDGINANQLETTARRYMGIKYKFGTGPFSQTGTFDCSSFMQFLFEKQNIELPRTARAQARLGTPVDRKSLKPGDLMFFYVPGRFSTDEVIGHVGLYVGDGKMIHSSPLPKDGVQESDINTPYWEKTFMKAVRLNPQALKKQS